MPHALRPEIRARRAALASAAAETAAALSRGEMTDSAVRLFRRGAPCVPHVPRAGSSFLGCRRRRRLRLARLDSTYPASTRRDGARLGLRAVVAGCRSIYFVSAARVQRAAVLVRARRFLPPLSLTSCPTRRGGAGDRASGDRRGEAWGVSGTRNEPHLWRRRLALGGEPSETQCLDRRYRTVQAIRELSHHYWRGRFSHLPL